MKKRGATPVSPSQVGPSTSLPSEASTAPARILVVGVNAEAVESVLEPIALQSEREMGIDAALEALGPTVVAAVLVPPLEKRSLSHAVALLRDRVDANWPILAVVPDGVSDLESRRLYRKGATVVFESPRELNLIPQMALELLEVRRRHSRATEADRALEKALRIRLNLIPGEQKDGRAIRVRVREGVAMLAGEVEALWVKERMRQSAAAMPGLVSVGTRDLDVVASGLEDGKIAANIRAVLRGAMSVEEQTLTVSVNDGHAILKGTVSSANELERLRELVVHAKGVRSITDRTERAPGKKRRDRDTARRLQGIVNELFPEHSVRVTVIGEICVLTGQVARLEIKQRIQAHVRRDDSVARVVNKMGVIQ